jgi:hypothetical protein
MDRGQQTTEDILWSVVHRLWANKEGGSHEKYKYLLEARASTCRPSALSTLLEILEPVLWHLILEI